MLIRILFNILIFFIILRMFRPVVRAVGKYIRKVLGGEEASKPAGEAKKVDYSDLTPYEIEDAEFEEVKGRRK